MPRLRSRRGLAAAIVLALLTVMTSPAAGFDDVPEDAFYRDAVEWMADQAITTGTSATTFSPDRDITRAEFVTLLWRYSGSPKPAPDAKMFGDAPVSGPFATAVKWVSGTEITTGKTPSTFAPGDPVSRAEAVTFLWRYMCRPAAEGSPTFADLVDGAFYMAAVAWANEAGIAKGRTASVFDPSATLTRGEAATLLWRLAGQPGVGEEGVNRSTDMPGCNRAPKAVDDAFATDSDTPIVGNVLAANPTTADSDPDGDPITVIASEPSIVAANGDFSFDPSAAADGAPLEETSVYEITYTISDPDGLTDTAVAVITVTTANHALVLDEIEPLAGRDGQEMTFTATASDPDGDAPHLLPRR
ncbi:MAG: S-layer homology domain-containing protein [Acidimicrobiales bacterium]